jgi:putative secretion ATPase (PEP-CTERM system associated)
MYETFYGFKKKPFQIVPNPEYLYKSPKHLNALTYLEYGLSENVGYILLTGEIGSGKTTLIQYILNKMGDDSEVAVIFNTNVSPYQLLMMILSEFEIPSQKLDKAAALDQLNEYLIEKYAEKKKVLLIIDEAQNLSFEALEEIRMLSNLHTDDRALIQIMLVGQPELIETLQNPKMLQFSQRIAVNFHLEGLDRDETAEYIKFRLEKSGGHNDIFTPEAIDMIYSLSGGIPRSINLLCQAALVYGFADEADTVDKTIIDQISQDKIGIGLETNAHPNKVTKASDSTANIPKKVLKRLRNLETEVQDIRSQLENRVRELEQRAEGFNEDLVRRLNQLLEDERTRNAKLLRKYTRLKMRYEALRRARKRLAE